MARNSKVCKLIMMKTILLIVHIIFWIGMQSQSQSNGYVLKMNDGSIGIANNALTIAQVNSLQTTLDAKATLASPTFTGTVSGITAAMVGLGNVTNESKATMFTSPTFTGNAVLGTPASGNFSTGTFTWPTFNQNTSGSAATLTTPRTIGGVSFDGSANITVATATGGFTVSGGNLALGTNSITMSGSIGVTGTRVTKIWSVDGEFTNMITVGGTSLASTFQGLATNLTSIGGLANGNGFLKNNGSGTFTYETPAGAGTVTNTGNLTANSVVLGNGTTDTKVVAGITTNGTAQISLGVNASTLGSVRMFGNTSGNVTLQPAAVAGTDVTVTLPNVTSTLLPNTTTSGVAATPTASGTTTVTHNLGRIPTIIRIYSISSFTSNAAATPVPFSIGTFNSTGNRCLYMVINGTTTQVSQTSTTFSIIMVTSAGNQITGVIQNVTSTGFDIVWTETGTHTAGNYLWEAQ